MNGCGTSRYWKFSGILIIILMCLAVMGLIAGVALGVTAMNGPGVGLQGLRMKSKTESSSSCVSRRFMEARRFSPDIIGEPR